MEFHTLKLLVEVSCKNVQLLYVSLWIQVYIIIPVYME